MARYHSYARHTHHFLQFLSNLSCIQTPWYLNIKKLLSFHSASLFTVASCHRSLLHLWNILSLKLQQSKSVQSCFTTSGIIETKLNYYLSNYFCEAWTVTVHGDIETLKFFESENSTSLYCVGENQSVTNWNEEHS